MPVHAFCSPQKGSRFTLGRSPGLEGAVLYFLPAASPSPANALSGFRSRALTYSGGTAPDLHRTSLLCPPWAPEAFTVISPAVRAGQGMNPDCRLVDSLAAVFLSLCARRARVGHRGVPLSVATSPVFRMSASRTIVAGRFCCDRYTAIHNRARRTCADAPRPAT